MFNDTKHRAVSLRRLSFLLKRKDSDGQVTVTAAEERMLWGSEQRSTYPDKMVEW